jgi:exonuclease III
VTLQEITAISAPIFRAELSRIGLKNLADSFQMVDDRSVLTGPRRYGLLIASRWPLQRWPNGSFAIPWPERVLSADVDSPWGKIELHTTYIPWGGRPEIERVRLEMFEGIYTGLARVSGHPRILTGDLNSPHSESQDGHIVTWTFGRQNRSLNDRVDRAQRDVLVGLARYDLSDVYRKLHGYGAEDYSWYSRTGQGFRVDHVFASTALGPSSCQYLHPLRENGLSDHSPLEVQFNPPET